MADVAHRLVQFLARFVQLHQPTHLHIDLVDIGGRLQMVRQIFPQLGM